MSGPMRGPMSRRFRWCPARVLLSALSLLAVLAVGCGGAGQGPGGSSTAGEGGAERAASDAPGGGGAPPDGQGGSPTEAGGVAGVLEALGRLPAEERRQALAERARDEGEAIWYGAYSLGEAEPLIARFQEANPGVRVQYFRASTAPLLDRITSEAAAGKLQADVIHVGLEVFHQVRDLAAPYCSPEREAFAPAFREPDCLWTAMYHDPKVVGYHTREVTAAEAPDRWEELADPRWRGRIGIPVSDGPDWVNIMLHVMGEERGMDYLRRMASQEVQLHKSNSGLAQLVGAGDLLIGFYLNNAAVGIVQGEGGPIGRTSTDPWVTSIGPLFITRSASHPHAAALLVDWILSREGQTAIAEINPRYGGRTDIEYPPLFGSSEPVIFTPELAAADRMTRATQVFEELFVRGESKP